jgi:hypothetical protein
MAGKDKAAAKQGPAELDPVALKLQHSIVYEANTSETKDDLPALVNILVRLEFAACTSGGTL